MKRYFRKSKKQLAAYTLSALFTAAIGVSQAFLLQYISETAMAGAYQGIPLVLVLVAGYLVLDTASDFAYGYSLRCACTKIAMDLRNDLLRRIQKCPIEEKEQKGDGFYLSMLNDQVGEVEEDYVGGLLQVLFQIFSLVFALAAATAIQPAMTLVVLVLCVLPLVVPKFLQKKLESTRREAANAKSSYVNLLSELMAGFSTLKIFGRSGEADSYHRQANAATRKTILYSRKWGRISMSLSYGLGLLVVLGAWVFGLIFAASGYMTVPQMIALTSLMTMVAGPFQIISELYASIVSGGAIAGDLVAFLDSDPGEMDTYKTENREINQIALSHARVVKGGRAILEDVSFQANRGEKICLIGPSGSGKSTLLRTIAGIVSIDEGQLLVDGQDLSQRPGLTHRELRYLSQDTVLFSASIGRNVSLFREMPEQPLRQAITQAGLESWFQGMGGNLDAPMEKSSVNLSGGEQKRFDFARILCEGGQILLFDEPTAGLDAANSRNVMAQIAAMENRILVVATHDLEAENMRRFDRIYLMGEGKVVFSGTAEEVLASSQFQTLEQG